MSNFLFSQAIFVPENLCKSKNKFIFANIFYSIKIELEENSQLILKLMAEQVSYRKEIFTLMVIAIEFVLLNLLELLLHLIFNQPHIKSGLIIWDISYIIAIAFDPPLVQSRVVRSDQIATRVLKTTFYMSMSFLVLITVLGYHVLGIKLIILTSVKIFFVLFISRTVCRKIIKRMRSKGRNTRSLVFVGAGINHRALYKCMTNDISTGYRVLGYFDDTPSKHFEGLIPMLGNVEDTTKWLSNRKVDMLFCNLPSWRANQILEIIDYCENHLIHFYSVPNVHNYVSHSMQVEFLDDIPVLTLRYEPLRHPSARLAKRIFDIAFSLTFLIFFFWWILIIVTIITKITMPGPIFFIQKRNGIKGKEFNCIKFRSMKVNSNADKLQATLNDPRKTRWGDILRKTNIDEMPQFINVLLGDMSVVGPRPHMLLHTEEYCGQIDKYMVRHYAKPGITGWAQVTGNRGETKYLWQMEERIRKDIWYVENWNFMLDIRIIIMTIFNMFGREKGNAY